MPKPEQAASASCTSVPPFHSPFHPSAPSLRLTPHIAYIRQLKTLDLPEFCLLSLQALIMLSHGTSSAVANLGQVNPHLVSLIDSHVATGGEQGPVTPRHDAQGVRTNAQGLSAADIEAISGVSAFAYQVSLQPQ
jgi:hypothetical protein